MDTLTVMKPMDQPDGVASSRSGLLRAMGLIQVIAERAPEELGVTSAARETGLPKAVAHRMLKDLVAAGFLAFDDRSKKYRLGTNALTVGLAALRTIDFPSMARPHMERLVGASGETTTLSMRTGWARIYVSQVVSPREVRMSVALGTQHPLHAGSSSKSILAALSDEDIRRYFDHSSFETLTANTIVEPEKLAADIKLIRSRGYAVSMGERQAAAGSVAAAIFDSSGEVWGSISLCGPRDRFVNGEENELGPLVAEAAASLSLEAGHRV